MAIDTSSKRASALSAGVIALSLVIPIGTVDQKARQTVVNLYSGILASEQLLWTDKPLAVTDWTDESLEITTWTDIP